MALAKQISVLPELLAHFLCAFVEIPVSSLFEATDDKLQGPGMTISKNATRVQKVTDFEKNRLPSDFNV